MSYQGSANRENGQRARGLKAPLRAGRKVLVEIRY